MGDGIRRIAKAYYERADEKEQNEAKDFFRRLDLNCDGKISLTEFRTGVNPGLLEDDHIFHKLDSNSDGALYFADVLVLFYMHQKKISFRVCDGCRQPLLDDQHFTCSQCLPHLPRTCDLCCACYRGAKFQHVHPLSDLMQVQTCHNNFILYTQSQSEMERLREIARAHYRAGSPKVQELAKEFFNSMDSDGDGQVDLPEFLSFMRQQGYLLLQNPHFFKQLDKDGNGTLDFWEVMTLYYIIKSRRPFCDACGEFIPGVFFSCVQCFKLESSYDLCSRCYQCGDCKHDHDGRTQFLDNYTLLQALRFSALGQPSGVTTQNQPMKAEATTSSLSRQIIVLPAGCRKSKTDVAFKALDLALNIANISTTMCSIL